MSSQSHDTSRWEVVIIPMRRRPNEIRTRRGGEGGEQGARLSFNDDDDGYERAGIDYGSPVCADGAHLLGMIRFDGRRGLGVFWQASSHQLPGQYDLR